MLVPRSGFIASEAAGSVNNSTLTSTLPAALTNGQILEMVFSSQPVILLAAHCSLLFYNQSHHPLMRLQILEMVFSSQPDLNIRTQSYCTR